MKLHLGCGNDYREGYTNVDLYSSKADLNEDVDHLPSIKSGEAEEILAFHVLEHLSFEKSCVALRRWFELLKRGGILILEVPDFKQTCLEFVMYDHVEDIPNLRVRYPVLHGLKLRKDWGIYKTWGRMRNIFGAQDTPGQYHKSGWWKNRLENELKLVGFSQVEMWRSCEMNGGEFTYHAREEPVLRAKATK